MQVRKKVKVVNRTPHPINIQDAVGGEIVTIPPSPPPLRLEETIVGEEMWEIQWEDANGEIRSAVVKVVKKKLSLPSASSPEDSSVVEIVSLPVAMSVPGMVAPDTGKGGVRDEKGNIAYVQWLCVIES